MEKQEGSYVVAGLEFENPGEAHTARIEQKRIAVLDEKLDYNNLDAVAAVYEKARQNQVFKTPLGIAYMLRLQQRLTAAKYEKLQIKPIHVPQSLTQSLIDEWENSVSGQELLEGSGIGRGDFEENQTGSASDQLWRSRLDASKQHEQELTGKLRFSVLTILVLAALVIVMFVISLTSNHPNILNYKSNLISKYSVWEKELEEREKAVEEKEAQLELHDLE